MVASCAYHKSSLVTSLQLRATQHWSATNQVHKVVRGALGLDSVMVSRIFGLSYIVERGTAGVGPPGVMRTVTGHAQAQEQQE